MMAGAGNRMHLKQRDWLAYVLPLALFLLLTTAEGYLPKLAGQPDPAWYAAGYAVKFVLVALAAWFCRPAWRDFRPRPRVSHLLLGVTLGLAVTALWIGLDGHYPALPLQGRRAGFDPAALPGFGRTTFLGVRLLGLVVLVPVIEELFWRSFLLRFVIAADFRGIPIGQVTWKAALVSSALFALAHPEWLPALITGLLWAWLLKHTRSLAACLASHMTANLALGIYILVTGSWKFW